MAAASFVGFLLSLWLRLCNATSRWQVEGQDELKEVLAEGPVVLVMWHSRIMMVGLHWPKGFGRVKTLNEHSPMGRIAGQTLRHLGYDPIPMKFGQSNMAMSRVVLRSVRDGATIGLAADGPEGPARLSKRAALDWARATKRPIMLFSWSGEKATRVKSWDRLMMPKAFDRCYGRFRKWDMELPAKMTDEAYEKARQALDAALDEITRETDRLAGRDDTP